MSGERPTQAGFSLSHTLQFFVLGGFLQLTSPEAMQAMQDGLRAHEGCQLECHLPVARVQGSFHVSVHSQSIELLHQIEPGTRFVNTSHTIKQFSFGPAFPGASRDRNIALQLTRQHQAP